MGILKLPISILLMNRIYDLDISKLALLLTPTFLRKERFSAWIRCLVSPLNFVYEKFLKYRVEDLYKLEHTAQVISLEKILNDRFDISQRRIEVGDIERKEPFYIYSEREIKPKYIHSENENKGKVYLYSEAVSKANKYDFIVWLPFDIWMREGTEVAFWKFRFYEMEALIDFYKLAGKRYMIAIKP